MATFCGVTSLHNFREQSTLIQTAGLSAACAIYPSLARLMTTPPFDAISTSCSPPTIAPAVRHQRRLELDQEPEIEELLLESGRRSTTERPSRFTSADSLLPLGLRHPAACFPPPHHSSHFSDIPTMSALLAVREALNIAAAASAANRIQRGYTQHDDSQSDQDCVISRVTPVPTTATTHVAFSQEHLDAVLYGYTKSQSPGVTGHALSGLRSGSLSYGIDQILHGDTTSKCKQTSSPRRSPSNNPVFNAPRLSLPEGLELRQTSVGGVRHYGVYCAQPLLPRGTRFGPFRGRVVNPSEVKATDDNSFMWEVFFDGALNHFIDGRGPSGCWMSYVNCARHPREQNLVAVQGSLLPRDLLAAAAENASFGREIYYETCKDVHCGSELLVWYGDCYVQFMGIPIAPRSAKGDVGAVRQQQQQQQRRSLMTTTEEECAEERHRVDEQFQNGEGFQCQRCGKVFAYKYYRDKHLKYTRCVDQGDRKFPCHLCSRSFEKRDRLRIHVLHVHEKHRPHKCSLCNKSFSQSSSLNKHMRVHSGERPYKCVYCSKAFTASSILRTHIRQHSGEKPFKCKFCGKAFASHAAHDSHVRRTHSADGPTNVCLMCGCTFSQARDLRHHVCAASFAGGALYGDDVTLSDISSAPSIRHDVINDDEPIDVVSVDGDVMYAS